MDQIRETPPGGIPAGLNDKAASNAFSSENDIRADAPTCQPEKPASQAKIELLVDDIGDTVGCLIATLSAALAMRDAGDTVGLVYSLRRARAYWTAISGSAKELVAADAERLSALRQSEAHHG